MDRTLRCLWSPTRNHHIAAVVLLLLLASLTSPASAGAPGKSALPESPGHHRLRFKANVDGQQIGLAYAIYIPRSYPLRGGPKPLLVFMSGIGERGTDHTALFYHGPAAELLRNPKLEEKFNMIILSPQCPPERTWYEPQIIKAVAQLVAFVEENWRVDRTREYVTGLSMGGKGTWLLAMETPDRFAAIAPICSPPIEADKAAQLLRSTAIWIMAGSADGHYTEAARQAGEILQKAGCDVTYTEIPNNDHVVWTRFYPQPKFYDWFLFNVKGKPAPPHRFNARQLLTIGANPPGNPRLNMEFKQFTPWWTLINCGEGTPPAGLLPSWGGRDKVFVTRPLTDQIPCLMQTSWKIPAGQQKASLNLVVGHARGGSWRLVVQLDGKPVFDKPVNAQTARNGWMNVIIDLKPYAGREVQMELFHYHNGNPNPTAYWDQIVVVLP